MMDRRAIGNAGARGDPAQRQGLQALFGEDSATGFEQGRFQVSVVVAGARLHRDSLAAKWNETIMTITDSELTDFNSSHILSVTRYENGLWPPTFVAAPRSAWRAGMSSLLFAAALWVAIHLGIGGASPRTWLASRLGERGFRIAFSLASILALLYLIHTKVEAEGAYLWTATPMLRLALEIIMLPALWFFLASIIRPNPTLFGAGRTAAFRVRGVQRVTRHPMLWAFAIWAIVHITVRGDSAALVFFGAFAVTALVGMPSVDAKLAAADPAAWKALADQTSIVPFAAILGGRNKLAPSEISGWELTAAAAIWMALIWGHGQVLGYSIWPAF
jgi:uncharacterized membrane protein